ncbi:hypothetical protein LTR53_010419 [Teratosphaeriaceae sp. CCFEE 6253]|nr:hypothetical protein LTR53_010419 [Teratosphaeriaceae sp. CCFEE 6253]
MVRYGHRLAAVLTSLVLLWLVWFTLEPRRTAYSCRTLRSCIGLDHAHSFSGSGSALPADVAESLVALRHGTLRFTRERLHADPTLLVLVLTRDNASWSSDFRSTQRSFHDFLDLLASTGLDLNTVSLGIWTSSADEFQVMKASVDRVRLARATIYFQEDTAAGAPYEQRHNPQVQLARRGRLATLRNRLMLSVLDDEEHMLWIDADVVELSPRIIQTMLQHSANDTDAGIITALCHQNQMINYDKNAWKVNSPDLLGPVPEERREAAVSKLVEERLMLPELTKNTDDDALVQIDSVGGTILYMRAELVRQGLVFPHFNIVGTTFAQTGWIGVETEGLCYMARGLDGGGCYVLGGSHHARHTDWG